MALTPEDVLNKTFTQTQFRKGYDEREVDDFLDEIVAEMRRSAQSTEEIRSQLNDCRAGRGLATVPAESEDSEATAQLLAMRSSHEDLQSRFAAVNADLVHSYTLAGLLGTLNLAAYLAGALLVSLTAAGWAPDGWARTLDTGAEPVREVRWHALIGADDATEGPA